MPLDRPLPRRTVLAGLAGLAGTATVAVSGCGSDSDDSAQTQPQAQQTPSAQPPADAASAPGAAPLATLADIPEGEAVVVVSAGGDPVVVARTGAATAAAFSAKCTHQGCTVKSEGKELACPCHGSRFEAATGKVIRKPADSPLPAVNVRVEGGKVLPA